jgi:hypothetical protein
MKRDKADQFPLLANAGFLTFLLPIIPPGAAISSTSQLSTGDCGKIPGKFLGGGEWCGFKAWSKHKAKNADIEEWRSWPGAGIGIKCGSIVGVDIDVTDESLSVAIQQLAQKVLGAAPCRIGNPPKRLLTYRIEEPLRKVRAEFTAAETGELHAVEVLGEGQQFVAEGIHPNTGKPYYWEDGTLSQLGFEGLTEVSADQIERFLGKVNAVMKSAGFVVKQGASKQISGTLKRRSIGDPALMGAPDLVKTALGAIGNSFGYDEWIKFAAAAKAAFGGDENHYRIYEEWCLLCPENTAEIARAKWDSFHDASIGAQFLFDRARDLGKPILGTGPVDRYENPILVPSKPMRVAERFVEDCYSHLGVRTLHRHREVFFSWNGTHYPEASDDSVRTSLYLYLDKAKKKSDQDGLVPFNPTRSTVNSVIDALKAVVHLPDDTVAPVWLDERKGSAAGDVLVCRNGLPPGRATSGRPSRMLEPCGSANPPSDFP